MMRKTSAFHIKTYEAAKETVVEAELTRRLATNPDINLITPEGNKTNIRCSIYTNYVGLFSLLGRYGGGLHRGYQYRTRCLAFNHMSWMYFHVWAMHRSANAMFRSNILPSVTWYSYLNRRMLKSWESASSYTSIVLSSRFVTERIQNGGKIIPFPFFCTFFNESIGYPLGLCEYSQCTTFLFRTVLVTRTRTRQARRLTPSRLRTSPSYLEGLKAAIVQVYACST